MKHYLTLILMLTMAYSLYGQSIIKEIDKQEKITSKSNKILELLPKDFPEITINASNNPAPGNLLLSVFSQDTNITSYVMVLDSLANPVLYRKPMLAGIDLKMTPNGLFSYEDAIMPAETHSIAGRLTQNAKAIVYLLDTSFNLVDSVQCKNGYYSDTHEFRMLPNGNYLMLAFESVPVDMSKEVAGGNPNAVVIGSVIQELDKDKNCVFQWRGLDHIPVTQTFSNTLNASFEHLHANSFFLDTDGNLIVSFAASFEIVKIDMITGEILWTMGGQKNEFNILNDDEYAPFHFSLQHDAKRLENGNLLFYDNGFAKIKPFSRAVEFEFDEENRTATKVWEYHRNPDIAAFAMGSAQRLENGNTLIGWGLILEGDHRTVTEVTSDKEVVYELSLPADAYSYRGLKYQFPVCQPIANATLSEALKGNTYKFNKNGSNVGTEIYLKELNAFMYNYMTMKKYDCSPMNPEFEGEAPVLIPYRYTFTTRFVYSVGGELRFDISKLPARYNYDKMKVFHRLTEGSGTFTELPTHLDTDNNKLVAVISDTGEYVIGFVREAERLDPPRLMLPYNNALLLNNDIVTLVWSSTGRYDYFVMELSDDDKFLNIIVIKDSIKETSLPSMLQRNKEYFWRVKTRYRDLESDWSETWKFRFSDPFLSIDYPVAEEVLLKDSIAVIRWTTNLPDSLSIRLYKNGVEIALLADSLYSYSRAYAWKISKSLVDGTDYSIKIASIKEDGMSEQTGDFTIKRFTSDVEDIPLSTRNPLLIAPNPSCGNTTISFDAKKSGQMVLKVCDMLGNSKAELTKYISEGQHSFDLNVADLLPGVYYCCLNHDGKTYFEKIVVMR